MAIWKIECPECLNTTVADVMDGRTTCPRCGKDVDCSNVHLVPVVPGTEVTKDMPAAEINEIAEGVSSARFVLFEEGAEAAVELFNGLFQEYGDIDPVYDGMIEAIADWVTYMVASPDQGLYECRVRYIIDQLEVGVGPTFAVEMTSDALDVLASEAEAGVTKERAEEILSNLYEIVRDILLSDGHPEAISSALSDVADVIATIGPEVVDSCENWYAAAFLIQMAKTLDERMGNLDERKLGDIGEIDLETTEEAIKVMEKVLNNEEEKPGEDQSKAIGKYLDRMFPQKGTGRSGRRAAVKKSRY